MEIKNTDLKQCQNCKYFLQHYFKGKKKFAPAIHGHCTREKLKTKYRIRYIDETACNFWQPAELREQERQKSINSDLNSIANRLEEIVQLLKYK